MKILVASRNQKKLAELRRIVAAARLTGVDIVGLDQVPSFPEVPESGATFAENALIKAKSATQATGLPTIADDSGLTIAALNGMPGVLSARWAGNHGDDVANLELVLAQLGDIPDHRRSAAFVCAVALVAPGQPDVVVEGQWQGRIIRQARGTGGFGYDPIFLPAGFSITAAEMSPAEKDDISHRGRALAQLLPHISELATRQ